MQIGMMTGGTGRAESIDAIIADAKQAEAEGYAVFGMANIFSHDAIMALAMAGAQTERIELMTAVTPTYPRHPHAIAQEYLCAFSSRAMFRQMHRTDFWRHQGHSHIDHDLALAACLNSFQHRRLVSERHGQNHYLRGLRCRIVDQATNGSLRRKCSQTLSTFICTFLGTAADNDFVAGLGPAKC